MTLGTFGSADLSISSPPLVGKFIVFEGGGGSGKDTLIELLKKKLVGRTDVVYTREPGRTPLGAHIRELLLSQDTKGIDPKTELLLFLASRAEHVEKIVAPALAAGRMVVSNRFALSSIAYQVYGRERPDLLPFAREALTWVIGECVPDLTLFLDAPPEIAIARAKGRPEVAHRFVTEELDFQERVYEGYKKHLHEFSKKTVVIDTSGAAEDAWKRAEKALESFL